MNSYSQDIFMKRECQMQVQTHYIDVKSEKLEFSSLLFHWFLLASQLIS